MPGFVWRCRRGTALMLAAAVLSACGGGGAALPSAPDQNTDTGGTPPSGGAPGTPSTPGTPSAPGQPSTPTQPSPTPPSAPGGPSSATIQAVNRAFSPATVTITLNGTVTWHAVDERHEIVFRSAAPQGGSPGELEEGVSATRTFTAAGSYDFECERHRDKGMRGTVIVVEAPAPPATPEPTPPAPTPPPSGSTATVTTPGTTFSPSNVTITAGGTVTWQFSGARHNVTFRGIAPAGGSIPDQDPGTSASRMFTTAGTYDYECTRHSGMTGRVTVQ